jgi:hypothetical protein
MPNAKNEIKERLARNRRIKISVIGRKPDGLIGVTMEPRTVRRRSRRTKSVVPVRLRIAGSQETFLAHTLNATNNGVRLGGYRGEMKVGDEIVIQYRHARARFRVIWIAALDESSEKQIGAECLESGKQLWGERFPERPDEHVEKE